MAELGVVASIIGIAAVGVSLSQKLYSLGSRTANAGHNIHRIATTVTLFSSSLKHVAQVMDDSSSLHTPAAVDTAMQIVNECTLVFEEVGNILKLANDKVGPLGEVKTQTYANDKKRRLSILQKVKWHFEQPKVEWLIAQLEYLKTTLSVLLQTLILAGVTAKAKSDAAATQEAEERIQRERMHVETLIVARQLSLIVLNQYHHRSKTGSSPEVEEHDDNGSEVETEDTLEAPPKQKLLTETGEDTSVLSLVRTGTGGNLEFLNRSMPALPKKVEEEESMSPIMSRSQHVVDQLLGRWTRLDQADESNGQLSRRSTFDLEGQSDEAIVQTPEGTSEDESNSSKAGHRTPEVKLEGVPATNGFSNGLVPIRTLDIHVPPFANGNNFGSLPPKSVTAPLQAHQTLPPPPSQGRPMAMRAATDPEHEPRSQFSPYRPAVDIQRLPPPNAVSSLELPGSPVASPMTSPLSTSPAEPRQGQTTAKPTKIRVPRGYSSSEDSESEDDRRGSNAKRLYGLGIPWRIRVGQKYFDFLDASLVGPRRPGLPTESKSWMYSHDNAVTEISSKWVAEEAIAEARLPYSELRPEDEHNNGQHPDYTWAGVGKHENDLKWRILQALQFEEVQSLVERTIDLYRSRHTPKEPQGNFPQPYVSGRPTSSRGSAPFSQQPQNISPAVKTYPKSALKPVQRSVSFSDPAANGLHDRWQRSRSGQFTPSPHLSPVVDPNIPLPSHSWGLNPGHPSPTSLPGSGTAQMPLPNMSGAINSGGIRDQFRTFPPPGPPPGSDFERERDREQRSGEPRRIVDYERDYHRDHVRDDEWNREFDRDRHHHREHRSKGHSSKSSTVSSKAEKEKRDAKKRQRSTAGTLARLGGLAALLEGLDAV